MIKILIFLLFSLSLSSDEIYEKKYVKEKIDEFVFGLYYGLSGGGQLGDLSVILGEDITFGDYIQTCFSTMPIEPSYLHYDVQTYEIANGRYELSNCGPFNLKMIEEYENGKLHGVRETYYANGNLMTRERFKNNEFHGLLESYNEDGSENYFLCYEEGLIVDTSICSN